MFVSRSNVGQGEGCTRVCPWYRNVRDSCDFVTFSVIFVIFGDFVVIFVMFCDSLIIDFGSFYDFL